MWIQAQDLLVLEVKARLIDVSPQNTYAVGTTLHGLYCRSLRHDKSAMECATLSEYLAMKERAAATVDRPQNALVPRKPGPVVSYTEKDSLAKQLPPQSSIFAAFDFMILSDHMRPNGNRISIHALASLVKANGGKAVLDIPRDFFKTLVISEVMVPLCGPLVRRGFTIIKPRWLFECVSRQQIVPLEPVLVLATLKWAPLAHGVDASGDSFIVHTNHLERDLLDGNSADPLIKLDPVHIEDFLTECHELDAAVPLRYMFYGSRFYVIERGSSNISINVLKNRLQSLGAEVIDKHENSTYIIVPKDAIHDLASSAVAHIRTSIADTMMEHDHCPKPTPHVISLTFIDTCIERQVVVDARDHSYF